MPLIGIYESLFQILDLFLAMPELLRSAKLAVEKGLSQGRNESYVKQLSDYIIPALVEALHKVVIISICPVVALFTILLLLRCLQDNEVFDLQFVFRNLILRFVQIC